MAAELVPVRLGVTAGDLYTLWAPRWRDAGDEWEAFLGKDEDLYAFESVADLAAFVRTNTDNDLTDHPGVGAADQGQRAQAAARRGPPRRPDRRRGAAGREAHRGVGDRAGRTPWPWCRRSARCASCPRSPGSSTATRTWGWCPAESSSSPARPDEALERHRRDRRPRLGRCDRGDRRDRHDPRRSTSGPPKLAADELEEPYEDERGRSRTTSPTSVDEDDSEDDRGRSSRRGAARRGRWCSAATRTSGSRSASTRYGS